MQNQSNNIVNPYINMYLNVITIDILDTDVQTTVIWDIDIQSVSCFNLIKLNIGQLPLIWLIIVKSDH